MDIRKISLSLLILVLVMLSISPVFALGDDQRNFLLIGVMGLSPFIILLDHQIFKYDRLLVGFMSCIILFPLLLHPESFRLSTILYSCMFCLTFMAIPRLMYHGNFTVLHYQKVLRYLIYAYAITLIIQQFCVLTGLPVFNQSFAFDSDPWKLNSLAAEPSHSARIMALLMYSYITVREIILFRKYDLKKDFRKDRWIWFSFLWAMLTMGSSTAFLFIPIVLLKFIRFRNLVPLFILGIVAVIAINQLGITSFERTYDTFIATLSLDTEKIIETDHSASFRIVPFIVLLKTVDISNINGWLGNGVDYVSTFMFQYMPGGSEQVSGGGILQIWVEYGFISCLIYIIFTLKIFLKNLNILDIMLWFLLILTNGLNLQITWFAITVLYLNNFYLNKLPEYKNGNSPNNPLLLVWSQRVFRS